VGLPETPTRRGARMTLEELDQKLAVEMLAKTGVGLVSEKTFEDIGRLVMPMNRTGETQAFSEINVRGIRLIKNPFIPDNQIYPFERWDFAPKPKREFPLKDDTL
jgi:hypothetical protein